MVSFRNGSLTYVLFLIITFLIKNATVVEASGIGKGKSNEAKINFEGYIFTPFSEKMTWLWIGSYDFRLADKVTGEPTAFAHRIADSGLDVISAPPCKGYYGSCEHTAPNLTPQVCDLFHSRGMIVEAAIGGTGTGERWKGKNGGWPAAKAEIDKAFEVSGGKIDAIHDGEVYHMNNHTTSEKRNYAMAYPFFKKYYEYVKNTYGKTVVFNTGTQYTAEVIMTVCDVLSVEWYGEDFMHDQPWAKDYPASRFMSRPISYNWRGTLQQAIDDIQHHWELGYKYVGCTYNPHYADHPFPKYYDWWDQLFSHFS